jgi:glycosyltransferase involved in cell wall biosynthesis
MKTPVVPSKALGFMAAKKPWIANVNEESDVRAIAQAARCALVCQPGDPRDMARAGLELYADRHKCRVLGENGYRYCEAEFSKAKGISAYDRILSELTAAKRKP